MSINQSKHCETGMIKSEEEWVGWANSSIVHPASLAKVGVDYQKDGSPTYNNFNYFISNRTRLTL